MPQPEFNFRLAIFPNPMRSDGVFLAEDKPIEPYPEPNAHARPAVPLGAFSFPYQLPLALAEEVVKRWNFWQDSTTAGKEPG
jgi:hypothetical protein